RRPRPRPHGAGPGSVRASRGRPVVRHAGDRAAGRGPRASCPGHGPRRPPALMRLGTRASALALAQAGWVAERLGPDAELVPITTAGDRGAEDEDKSRWVSELERALLAGEIDLAVHSAKDVPAKLP